MRVRNGQIQNSTISLSADEEIAGQEGSRINEVLENRTLHEIRDWKALLSRTGVTMSREGVGAEAGKREETIRNAEDAEAGLKQKRDERVGEVGGWLNSMFGVGS